LAWEEQVGCFAIEHDGVEPDFMVLAKALGGDLPMSAVIARKDIVKNYLPIATYLPLLQTIFLQLSPALTWIYLRWTCGESSRFGDYAMARLREIAKEREIIEM